MAGKPSFYVTTPIYYVNDSPHIGHAYTSLACDVLARFKRLDGYDVKFLTGTDEHGQKVEKSAQAAGIDPQSLHRQRVAELPRPGQAVMNYSNDDFIRTTEPRHIRCLPGTVEGDRCVPNAQGKRQIYLASYGGWYSVRDEAFWGEDELVSRRRRQENSRPPARRWNGWRSRAISSASRRGATAARILRDESRFHRAGHPTQRGDQLRQGRAAGFVGLADQLQLGRAGAGRSGAHHVCLARRADQLHHRRRLSRMPRRRRSRYWPADLHMVGKDILRFHAVYWPAFLMAAGLAPPKRVFAHGWWTNEGQKISKSLGNVIDPLAWWKLRPRPGALFPAARSAVRQRRRFFARGHGQPDEQRTGQRSGQSGATLAVA